MAIVETAASRETYDRIYGASVRLHLEWKQYRTLFGESEKRLNLLNEAAGSFFHVIQFVLLDHVCLEISKLLDKNAEVTSLHRLLKELGKQNSQSDIEPLRRSLDGLVATAKPIVDRRHLHVAHRNHRVATGADPIPGISRANVESALLGLRELLNSYSCSTRNTGVAFEIWDMWDDADALVRVIEKWKAQKTDPQ